MGFSTDAIHVGQEPDPLTGAIVAPIYQTSTYVIEEMGKSKGYDYARTSHPNRKALERTLAKLEGGSAAFVFTSGMAGDPSRSRRLDGLSGWFELQARGWRLSRPERNGQSDLPPRNPRDDRRFHQSWPAPRSARAYR